MLRDTVDYQALDTLLDELDTRARRQTTKSKEDSYWVCHRKHPRHPFRSRCTIRFMPSGGVVVATTGRTRNLCRNGIAVLVRRMFALGEPVEIEVTLPERSRMYMGGLARFCRYAGRGYYEIGIELKATASTPIFSGNPMLAIRALDWLSPEGRGF
ncbi:MAG TPA: PilZ domain-containing protein [Phycisphaerae bacterium]|nr:PilZ domain-containing protein [Phycisphaerae bacterium]